MNIYIDEKLVTVNKIKPSNHGFLEVFVSNGEKPYAARHLLPEWWLNNNDMRGTVKTGGHVYKKGPIA